MVGPRGRLAVYILNSQKARELPTISNIVPEADKLTVAGTDRGDGKKDPKYKKSKPNLVPLASIRKMSFQSSFRMSKKEGENMSNNTLF